MLLMANDNKPTNTFVSQILTVDNFKSANEQLQNSGILKDISVNEAMLITMNRMITHVIYYYY